MDVIEKITEEIHGPPYWVDPDGVGIIYCGDARDLIPYIPPSIMDITITDPPYASLMKWKGIGTTARMGLGREGSGSDDPDKFFPVIADEDIWYVTEHIYDMMKDGTHTYIMCDSETLFLFYDHVFDNRKVLIWDKVFIGMGYHYRNKYECIVMLDKGKNRKLADLGMSDILEAPRIAGKQRLVPTQKPVVLFEKMVLQSSDIGEVGFDPFFGSGSSLIALKRNGRRYVGIEIQPKYCDVAIERLSETPVAVDYSLSLAAEEGASR